MKSDFGGIANGICNILICFKIINTRTEVLLHKAGIYNIIILNHYWKIRNISERNKEFGVILYRKSML